MRQILSHVILRLRLRYQNLLKADSLDQNSMQQQGALLLKENGTCPCPVFCSVESHCGKLQEKERFQERFRGGGRVK